MNDIFYDTNWCCPMCGHYLKFRVRDKLTLGLFCPKCRKRYIGLVGLKEENDYERINKSKCGWN